MNCGLLRPRPGQGSTLCGDRARPLASRPTSEATGEEKDEQENSGKLLSSFLRRG